MEVNATALCEIYVPMINDEKNRLLCCDSFVLWCGGCVVLWCAVRCGVVWCGVREKVQPRSLVASSSPFQNSMSKKHLIHFDKHKNYLLRSLSLLPQPYSSQDPNRLTLAYFIVAGLDILQALDTIDKTKIVDWIYSLQILPDKNEPGFITLLSS
jgi:hypothetical protein